MIEVEAIRAFVHGGRRSVGDRFAVSPREASLLASKSLVMILPDEDTDGPPVEAAGEKLSASPAAPASPNPTAERRKRGRPRKMAAESSP